MKRKNIRFGNVLFNILAIVTVALVSFTLFNIAMGAKGYAVTSNSMADTLKRGDLVLSRKVEFAEIEAGDIVTVGMANSDNFFTHRVVSVNDDKTVTTKGDNNPENDPMDTPSDRIVGKLWYSVPLLGYFSIAFGKLTQTKLLIILASFAVLLMGINTVASAINKRKNGGVVNE